MVAFPDVDQEWLLLQAKRTKAKGQQITLTRSEGAVNKNNCGSLQRNTKKQDSISFALNNWYSTT